MFLKILTPALLVPMFFFIGLVPFAFSQENETDGKPKVTTSPVFFLNEDLIESVNLRDQFDIEEPGAVLYALLSQIQPEADIYPSENYYYFQFYSNGLSYSGSLRLSAETRNQGGLQFNYYETYNNWERPKEAVEEEFFFDDGVFIEKIDKFTYLVKYRDVEVTFHLHQLKMELPEKTKLSETEVYVGSLLDESGLFFDLIFDNDENYFFFLLNTNYQVNEKFISLQDDLFVGKRTGFAFYRDASHNRYILVAVNKDEVFNNTMYDGPFDQLPENYYQEINFFNYVYKAYPSLRGEITQHGTFLEDGLIFAIFSYRLYRSYKDLKFVEECKEASHKSMDFYKCITTRPDN